MTHPRHAPARRLLEVMTLLFAALSAGCEYPNPLRQPNSSYPAAWPAISHLGPDCSAINGTYSNAGVFVSTGKAAGSGEKPLQLTSLLYDRTRADTTNVTLTLTPRRVDEHGNTTTSLQFDFDEPHLMQPLICDTFCIDGDLAFPNARSEGGGIPYLFVYGWQSNLWLSRADDGSLIVRVEAYDVGMVVAVPYFVTNGGWAKFARVEP